jgi:hypothetical protein
MTDSLIVTCPDREAYPGERFRVIKRFLHDHTLYVVLMDVNGFKLSVPYGTVVPITTTED